jgi:hypothetical protein
MLFSAVKLSGLQVMRTKVYVYLAENAGGEQPPDFVIRGSYYDGACTEPGSGAVTQKSLTGGS